MLFVAQITAYVGACGRVFPVGSVDWGLYERQNGTREIIPTFSGVIMAEFGVERTIKRSAPMGEWRSAQNSGRVLAGAYSSFRN
jgi:hypothetical protein